MRLCSIELCHENTLALTYEKIEKVYSIWICMNPPKNRENTITRYRLVEERVSIEQAMSVLEVPKAEQQKHMDLLERQ